MISERMFIKLYNKGLSSLELGEIFGYSERTIQRYEAKLRNKGKIGYRKDLLTSSNLEEKINKKEVLENNVKFIYKLKEVLSKDIEFKPSKIHEKNNNDLIIHLTDWHVGRIVKDEFGNILYDSKIFQRRFEYFLIEIINYIDHLKEKIDNVHVISTGDLVDGIGIFDTQSVYSEIAPPFQVMNVFDNILLLFKELEKLGVPISFYGVKGNHGDLKIDNKKTNPLANWDLMVYLMLDFWSKEIKKKVPIYINYSELDYLNFDIKKWNYHIRHYAPKQSETSSGKAKFLGWAKKHGFDVIVFGHYHHWGAWDRSKISAIRGGSFTGGDEYAEALGEESFPCQLIWLTNKHFPVYNLFPIIIK